jgi:hypothetical protein
MSNNFVINNAKIRGNKTLYTIALILMLTIAITLIALPLTNAHTPAWTIPTYAYLAVSPNPVGVGQQVFLVMWIDKVPPTAAGNGGDRWTGFTVEITKPDGTKQTIGPFTSDATSSTFTTWTPTAVGTYSFLFKFPGQVAALTNPLNGLPGDTTNVFVNDTFTASSATATLTVQQNPLTPVEDYPLPTSYWTRPIEGGNTAWTAVASNWLGGGYTYIYPLVQPTGIAPNSPHIMWTNAFQDGGVVGGNYAFAGGMTFYDSLSYETKFGSALIMYGRLYYTLPRSDATSGNGYVCVDLRTGEQLFWINDTMPTFGQYYMYDSPNQHGVIPNGYMWRSVTDAANGGTVHMAYDPINGYWLFNETNVPSGTTVYGPNGEITIYQLNNNAHWLALWNNTAAPNLVLTPGTTTNAWQWRPVGKNVNASTAYSWNVTIPQLPTGTTILKVIPDDIMIGSVNFPAIYAYIGGVGFGVPSNTTEVMWAISLKPASRGQLLWQKVFTPPLGNITRGLGPVDPVTRVFTMTDKETMQWLGYNIDNGEQLWGPVGNTRAYQFYGSPMFPGQTGYTYLGHLYVGGYGGIVYCYDLKNGNLLWTYGNGGAGNSTNSGLDTPWGNYPTYPAAFADGKIFTYTSEHSPNAPPYKGARIRAIDANTGKEVWTLLSWSSSAFAIADGYATYLNLYDNQIYSIGKGLSAVTVEAPLTALTQGQSVMIRGTVTDQTPSPEAKGTPAISDDNMGPWMEYLYMQKPIPGNATGVSVKLTALDPNGNTQDIGTVTSDMSGLFMKMWTPPVPGEYKIIATFAGSESYWSSYAETALGVVAAPSPSPAATPTTPPPTATPTPTPAPTATASPSPAPQPEAGPSTDMYIIAAAAAVIFAAVAAAAVFLRKHK